MEHDLLEHYYFMDCPPTNGTKVQAVGNLALEGALRDLESPARTSSHEANMVQKNRRVESVQAHLRSAALRHSKAQERKNLDATDDQD